MCKLETGLHFSERVCLRALGSKPGTKKIKKERRSRCFKEVAINTLE